MALPRKMAYHLHASSLSRAYAIFKDQSICPDNWFYA